MQRNDAVLSPGVTFESRYEIVAKLGQGGFGVVYKARQLSTGQLVALKILRLSEAGGVAQTNKRVARFLRETRLCAQLRHPNIVQLVDSGQLADGTLYIAFAFAPGDNLGALVEANGALAPREARHLMLQVLDALACAHREGVVHRDLKPSNIMVIPTGARRNALVLDFGIGTMIDNESPSRLTGSHDTLGTPGYGAPEQWRGAEPSPRADLFSWALVFLECLTGKPVYSGTAAEIFYRLLGPDPVPIPAVLERHPLGNLLARALHKDVDAREVTAGGLLEALDACDLRGLSREARHTGGESTRWIKGSAPILETSAPAPEGERRQVTAISCALVSTASQRAGAMEHGAEDLRLRAGLGLSVELARHHGGHVAAILGDELLVYFGYPRAEEDDARRAVRAALGIVDAIAAKCDGLRAQIGVHTGLVVAHDDGEAALAAGCTARLASRLARTSAPGVVLVTADAHKLLRGWFALEAEGVRAIEEAGAPLKVFRPRSAGQMTGPAPEATQAPLVGREQEMELLMDRWRWTRAGSGQSSLVIGEPGIGKSRLVRELRARLVDEAHTFVEGRCAPDTQNNALFPVVDLLGRALGLDTESSTQGKVARLEAELARHGLTPAETMPLFLPLFGLPSDAAWAPLDVSPQKQKELTLNGILALLFALAEERPVLFVIEDLHWADATTLELLGQLVREAPSAPMYVLLTARLEFSPAFPTIGVLQVHLNRLERAQIEAMVAALTGKKALPSAVLEQVANRTDGVPLFIEELTTMMVDSGSLVERDGRYELSCSLSELEIPSTLRGLLTARLDRLGRAKETAQLAAALGREFSVEVLAAVSALGPKEVQQDLNRLMGAGLVLRKRRVKDPVAVFKHALVRDAAYASLAVEARRKVHASIAATLEDRFQGIVEARPDLLAHHHAAAEQKRVAIGYAQKAAMGALMRSANAEALGYTRDALPWLSVLDEPRERATTELGLNGVATMALMSSKGFGAADVAATVRRSQELLDTLGDGPDTVPTLWALFMYHHLQNHRAKARSIAEQLRSFAVSVGDVSQEVATLPILGQCFYIEGRLEESRKVLERAVALYDPAKHRGHAFAYGLDSKAYAQLTLGLVLWLLGYPEQALAQATSAVAWAKELNHANTLGLALLYLVGFHHYQGDRAKTIEVTDTLVEVVDRYGLSMIKGFGGTLRAWANRDVDGVMHNLEGLRASGQQLGWSYWLSLVAESEAAGGQYDRAIGHLEDCLRYAETNGEFYYVPELHRLKGDYLLRSDPSATSAGEACFQRSLAAARQHGTKTTELRAALALGRILRARGQSSAAAELLAPIYARFTEGFTLPELQEARALLQDPASQTFGLAVQA